MQDPFAFEGSYEKFVQDKMAEVITHTPARRTVLVIRKALENLVLAERLAASKGIEISERDKRQLIQRDYVSIQEEVDRAMGEFIGSILSAEGG